jgi:hypothetical protein
MRESFKDFVARRERTDESIWSAMGSSLNYWRDRQAVSSDPQKLAAGDAIDAFGANFSKNKQVQRDTAKDINAKIKAGGGFGSKWLQSSGQNLEKHVTAVGDDWNDLTAAAQTRKIPVRTSYV